VNLSNVLISGMVHRLRERLKVPVIGSLQGDDIFLEFLPESYRRRAIDLISAHCSEMQGFIATSKYYADFMAEYLRIPQERIDVVHPGINLNGHGIPMPKVPLETPTPDAADAEDVPFTIGYFARICPEKGLHHLVDAFLRLRTMPDVPTCRLLVSGWLGQN